jgi:hypothetical protein
MGKGATSTGATKMPTDFFVRYTDEVRFGSQNILPQLLLVDKYDSCSKKTLTFLFLLSPNDIFGVYSPMHLAESRFWQNILRYALGTKLMSLCLPVCHSVTLSACLPCLPTLPAMSVSLSVCLSLLILTCPCLTIPFHACQCTPYRWRPCMDPTSAPSPSCCC